jgi:ethanolamine ammonia-lyase small subunit
VPSKEKPEQPADVPSIVGEVSIEVSDPTVGEERRRIGVENPANASGLANLAASTSARLAVGRAGPRPRTRSVLLFGADHAVTQDAIFGDVPTALLEEFGLFTVQTRVSGQDEFLLRPDLGRMLDDDAKKLVDERCVKKPQVQIVVGDGLSAAAVTNNLPQIYPVIEQGLAGAGISLGTPFFVRYCRVGIINDINDIVQADVVALLIGERPGLGVADALSVYSGWRPTAGKTDAHRDVICMITQNGGTNPLEAGAFVVEHVKTVLQQQASGIELRQEQSGNR